MNLPNMIEAKKRTKNKVNYEYFNMEEMDTFKNKKYFIRTYGCQMNVHDSEEIKALLEKIGFEETIDMENADLILLNTCAVRENAHDKVFGFLGRCKHLKKDKKDLIIGLCGCMAQEEHVVNEILDKHKYIDIVFGTHNLNELPNMLLEQSKKQNINVKSIEGDVIEVGELYKRDSKYSAWVNIMYGCDKFCTYCIVPYTRGRERSRKKEDILEEVKSLVDDGYKEITVLGQNVNAYGKDFEDIKYTFANLLKDLHETDIKRIRFTTSHPRDLDDETIETMALGGNIMPHLHLPVQSGNNEVLKRMNRKYTHEEYLSKINKLKSLIPDISITTDIIVAFPGETEEQFQDTIKLVHEVQYDGAFTFIYSQREGTPAAKLPLEFTEEEKHARLNALNEVINEYSYKGHLRFEGKTVEVLLEGPSKNNPDIWTGYTKQNMLVNFMANGKDVHIGDLVNVKITKAYSWHLFGEL